MKIKEIQVSGEMQEAFTLIGIRIIELRQAKAKAEKDLKVLTNEAISLLDSLGLDEIETATHKVTKQDVSRTIIDNNVAKVVIPKKYLSQIMKTTDFARLLVKEKELVV